MSAELTNKIVVGVDGSESAQHALTWAIDEAKLRGARIQVVTAWFVAPMMYGAAGLMPPTGTEQALEREADEVASAAAGRARQAGVEADTTVQVGQAAHILIGEAQNADLLVVGCRGHGGFTGLLLGSVSAQCAHHAPCPVVIVR